MKILIALALSSFLFSQSAHADRFIRCKSDRHAVYFCSPVKSGYLNYTIVSRVSGSDAAVISCDGFRETRWFPLRRGINHMYSYGDCYYWIIRQHK